MMGQIAMKSEKVLSSKGNLRWSKKLDKMNKQLIQMHFPPSGM